VEAIEAGWRDAGHCLAIHCHAAQGCDVQRRRGELGAVDFDAAFGDHALDIAAGSDAGAGERLGDALRRDFGEAFGRRGAFDARRGICGRARFAGTAAGASAGAWRARVTIAARTAWRAGVTRAARRARWPRVTFAAWAAWRAGITIAARQAGVTIAAGAAWRAGAARVAGRAIVEVDEAVAL
jgi:hypothetical protein